VGLHKAIFNQVPIDFNGLIFHNHPTGNIQPGDSDKIITKKTKYSCTLMDIELLDHFIIIPEGKYYCMEDEWII
jgi:DNA repair protein RadC